MNKDIADFPLVMQWNKRDLQEILPVTVLEQYLNPFRVPSFEAIAVTGQGVIESCVWVSIPRCAAWNASSWGKYD